MSRRITGTILVSIAVCGFMLILSGCNTVEGAGKDVEKGGQAIQRAAD